MSQHDFGNLESPLSGSILINTHLEPWRDALHSCHAGSTRPAYAVPSMMWINNSVNPWVLNVFDGSQDISIGTIDTATNAFTLSGGVDLSTITGISAFAKTILDDADAAAVRTTIGLTLASQAEAEAGVENTKVMTALRVFQAIAVKVKSLLGFGAFFESSEITYVDAAWIYSANHGIGAMPKMYQVVLRCKIAQNDFNVGDEINFGTVHDGATFNYSSGCSSTAVFAAHNAPLRVLNKAATAIFTLTAANWRVVLRAWG